MDRPEDRKTSLQSQLGASGVDDFRPVGEGGRRAMEPLAGSPMLGEGKINLISLEAIAKRLGPRWQARRDPIYEHVERIIARYVGADGNALRISDTDYLIVQPETSRFAAQARCLRCLREVLTYFLGQARLVDLDVREVTSISEQGVQAALIDATAVMAGAERESAAAASAQKTGSGDQWSPFLASNGQRVRVSCTLEPVLELKGYTRIGYRVARRVLLLATDEPLSAADHSRLTRADMERIDFATIARGLDRLRSDGGGEMQPSLIIPVSYISLSNQRSRAVLIGLFQQAQQVVKRGLICEVCDIDGVPQAALLTATSFIKPYCLFVVGRTASERDSVIRNLRGTGLQAISFEAAEGLENDADFFHWARTAITAAKSVAKSVMIFGLADAKRAALVASLGATHASIRSVKAGGSAG